MSDDINDGGGVLAELLGGVLLGPEAANVLAALDELAAGTIPDC